MRSETLTKELITPLVNEPPTVMTAINSNMTAERLADQDGHMTWIFTVQCPTFVSNRTMFVTYYFSSDESTGVITIASSSTGNDAFEESEVDRIDGNVVGHLLMSYYRFEPHSEGGYNIEASSCFNPEGWLPGFVQQLGVK